MSGSGTGPTCQRCGGSGVEPHDWRGRLTRRQREIYDWLLRYENSEHEFPTFEKIAEGINVASLGTVHEHLNNLADKGWLRRLTANAHPPFTTEFSV